MNIRKAIATVGLAGIFTVGAIAPANAYSHGQIYDCKVQSTSYTSYSKTYNYQCKKQFGSIPGHYTWHYYSKTYPLRGTTW